MGLLKKIFKPIVKIFEKAVSLVAKVFSAITSPFGMNIDVPDYDIGTNQADAIQGVLVNKDSAIVSIPVVYGTRRVGGTRVFVSTNGTDNKYLYVAIVLSEGQVNGYTQLIIDDNTVPLNSYTHGVETTASSGLYQDRILVQFFDGRDDQTVSTLLDAAPGWDSNHRLQGLAYLALRFEWRKIVTQADSDNNPYTGGVPNIKALLQGKKIFDLVAGYSPTEYAEIASVTPSTDWTISNASTFAFKKYSLVNRSGIINAASTALSGTGDKIRINSIIDTASVTVTLSYKVTLTGDDRYAAASMRLLLRAVGGSGTLTFHSAPNLKVISVNDGEVSGSFAHTFENLNLAGNEWEIEPQIQLSSVSGPVFNGEAAVTVQVQTPAIEDHTTLYANETVAFNNNPVNVLLDYMRNPRYGKSLGNESFNWISWREAALLCNQTVTYANSETSKAFTTDAVIDTENTLMTNCKILLANFRCMMPYTGGKYQLQIEHGGDNTDITATPVVPAVIFTVTNAEIIGGMQLSGESKEYKCNRAVVTYVDPSADYEPNDVAWPEENSATDLAYMAQDGVRLEKRITLPALANRKIAEQYAQVFVKRSRNQKSISFSTNMATSNATVGDLIRVINEYIGLDGIFRITDIRIRDTGEVEFSAIEHQSSAFAITGSGTDYLRPTISLPDPDLIIAPTSLTLQSGAAFNTVTNPDGYSLSSSTIARLSVSWTASTDPFTASYLVQWRESTAVDWQSAGTTTETELFIPGVDVGDDYDARVATLNQLGNRSDWITVTGHTIIQ